MIRRIPDALPEVFFLTAVVFGPLAFGATEKWSVAVLESLLFAAAALCLLRGRLNWGHPILKTLLPGVGVLLLIGFAQYLNPRAAAEPAIFRPFTTNAEATRRALVLWSAYAALLFSAPQVLASRESLRRALWVVFLLGTFIAVVGLMQRGQGNEAYYGLRPIRTGNPFGPYTNKNHAASVLVLSAFAGAGLWLSRLVMIRRTEQRGRLLEAWMIQVLIAFFLGVVLVAIAYIRSRGAIQAMVISATFIGLASLVRVGAKARWLGTSLVVACIAAVFGSILRDPIWVGREMKSSAHYRLDLYRSTFDIVKDFPIFGTGLATYQDVFPAYWKANAPEGRMEHAHNDWLEILTDSGVAGFTAYLSGLFGALLLVGRAWLAQPPSGMRCWAGACLAAALSFSLHGLVDFSLQIPGNAVLFLTMVACALTAVSHEKQPHKA